MPSQPRTVQWERLRRGEVAAAAAHPEAVLLMPTGAVEQHGPRTAHLQQRQRGFLHLTWRTHPG